MVEIVGACAQDFARIEEGREAADRLNAVCRIDAAGSLRQSRLCAGPIVEQGDHGSAARHPHARQRRLKREETLLRLDASEGTCGGFNSSQRPVRSAHWFFLGPCSTLVMKQE